jgi:hypothetical protein
LQNEIEKSMKEMRNKKATGDDDVPEDVLKLLGESSLKIVHPVYISSFVSTVASAYLVGLPRKSRWCRRNHTEIV